MSSFSKKKLLRSKLHSLLISRYTPIDRSVLWKLASTAKLSLFYSLVCAFSPQLLLARILAFLFIKRRSVGFLLNKLCKTEREQTESCCALHSEQGDCQSNRAAPERNCDRTWLELGCDRHFRLEAIEGGMWIASYEFHTENTEPSPVGI